MEDGLSSVVLHLQLHCQEDHENASQAKLTEALACHAAKDEIGLQHPVVLDFSLIGAQQRYLSTLTAPLSKLIFTFSLTRLCKVCDEFTGK